MIVDMASFQLTQDEAALTVVAMARGSSVWERAGEAGNRLLAVLPDTVVLRAAEWRSPLVPLLLDEMAREEVGQASLLDRLRDSRPAPRRHRHRLAGGGRGRLPQPVLLQQRLQAGLRRQPDGLPVLVIVVDVNDVRIRPMRPEDVVDAERLSSESFYEVDLRLTRRGDPDPEPRSAERGGQWVDRTRHYLATDPEAAGSPRSTARWSGSPPRSTAS